MAGKRRLRSLLGASLLFLSLAPAALGAETGKDALAGAKWKWSSGGDSAAATFVVDDPAACGGAWIVPSEGFLEVPKFALNGKPVDGPIPGIKYHVIPFDPKQYLVKGENVLAVAGMKVPATAPAPARLAGLEMYPPGAVGLQSGPVLGAIGPDYFTVTCRTNMPAEVVVTAVPADPAGKEISAASPRGFFHRFRIDIPRGTKKLTYTVTSISGDAKKTDGPFTVRVPGTDEKNFRFVVVGDSRSNPDGWKDVAAAALKAEPELVAFTGDLVGDGLADHSWDQEFFAPARDLLASVPLYPVLGNHDHNSAIYYEMFYTASKDGKDGKGDNWAQAVGGVLFIGVDGEKDWKADSKNVEWLDGVLKDSKEKFIFFVTHYPAWSSGTHGGRNEGPILNSRDAIMPVLARHKATAMFAGHDHFYERNEPTPDKGVTCIVAGGAGAPLYKKSGRGSASNPYSKVFNSTLHYCVLDVTGDKCEMKVYGLDGKLIDERTFNARQE